VYFTNEATIRNIATFHFTGSFVQPSHPSFFVSTNSTGESLNANQKFFIGANATFDGFIIFISI
jgi:hypothetical protein